MPLGFLMSATEAEIEELKSHASDEIFEAALTRLFELKLQAGAAVETGRGHIPLEGYLIEDENLSDVLTGQDTVKHAFDQELIVQFNRPSVVRQIATTLTDMGHEGLNALYKSYALEMLRPEPAGSPKKQGFFAKIFGQKTAKASTVEPDVGSIDTSLVEMFDAIRNLYADAVTRKENIVTMVRV